MYRAQTFKAFTRLLFKFLNPQLLYALAASSLLLLIKALYKVITPSTKEGSKILIHPKSNKLILLPFSQIV